MFILQYTIACTISYISYCCFDIAIGLVWQTVISCLY